MDPCPIARMSFCYFNFHLLATLSYFLISRRTPQRVYNDARATTWIQHASYTVAWICALHIEMAASLAMLDETHDPLRTRPDDSNAYKLGRTKQYNVVIACLPTRQYRTNNAANVVTNLKRKFPSIRAGMMDGIGGGVPSKVDIHAWVILSLEHELCSIISEKSSAMERCRGQGYPESPISCLSQLFLHSGQSKSWDLARFRLFYNRNSRTTPVMVVQAHRVASSGSNSTSS